MTEPTMAAGRLAQAVRDHFDRTAIPMDSLRPTEHAMLDALAAYEIEAEARQQDGSALRTALLAIQDDPFTNHGPASKVQQMRWIARQALAALPPMSMLPEIRRLLRETEAILAPARLREAPHPIVPIAIASILVRDALYLLEREPTEVSHAVSHATADTADQSGPERSRAEENRA